MWSRIVSTKNRVKHHLVTLEDILIEWFVKWAVYKILDILFERARKIRIEGNLHGILLHYKAASFIVAMDSLRNFDRRVKFSKPLAPLRRRHTDLFLFLPHLFASPFILFSSIYREYFGATLVKILTNYRIVIHVPYTEREELPDIPYKTLSTER